MTKKRRIAAIAIFGCLALSTLSFSLEQFLQTKETEKEEPPQMEVLTSSVHGISFVKSVNASDSKAYTLIYALSPEDADKEGFSAYLRWNDDDSANKEEGWLKDDMKPETYVTYSFDYENKKIAFKNLEAFGHEMIFTMMSNTDSSAKAELTINYIRKELNTPTFSLSNDTLENGKEIEIQYTDTKWSVGTKGDTATEKPTYTLDYYDATGSGKTYDDLIPQVTRNDYNPFYQEKISYNGGVYNDDYAAVKKEMVTRSKAYIESCISLKGDSRTTMDLATFKATMSFNFQYKNGSGTVVTATQSSIFTKFLNNYASAYEQGSGLMLHAYYKGTKIKDFLLNIVAGNYGISSITFVNGDGNIDF